HPAFGPGATGPRPAAAARQARFNPHPAFGPGATSPNVGCTSRSISFQSSPGPKAECDEGVPVAVVLAITFQSSPGPKAECDLVAVVALPEGLHVSILTRPEGRVRLGGRAAGGGANGCQSALGRQAERDAGR